MALRPVLQQATIEPALQLLRTSAPSFLWAPTSDAGLYREEAKGLVGRPNSIISNVQYGGIEGPLAGSSNGIVFDTNAGITAGSYFFIGVMLVSIFDPSSLKGAFVKIGDPDGIGFGGGDTTFDNFGSRMIVLKENIAWMPPPAGTYFVPGLNVLTFGRTTNEIISFTNHTLGIGNDAIDFAPPRALPPSSKLYINGYPSSRGTESVVHCVAIFPKALDNSQFPPERERLASAFSMYGKSARARWGNEGQQLFRPKRRFISLPGGLASIFSDESATYNLRSLTQSNSSQTYNLRQLILSSITPDYFIRTAINSSISEAFNIRSLVQSSTLNNYNLRAELQKDLAELYNIREDILSSASQNYNIRSLVLTDTSNTYIIRDNAVSDWTSTYNVAGGVLSSTSQLFNIRAQALSSITQAYNLRALLNKDISESYAIRSSTFKDLSEAFNIRTFLEKDLTENYNVRLSTFSSYSCAYSILSANAVTSTLIINYNVRSITSSDGSYTYSIRQSIISDKGTEYVIRVSLPSGLTQEYNVRALSQKDSAQAYGVRSALLADRNCTYVIQGLVPVQKDLEALYNILQEVSPDSIIIYLTPVLTTNIILENPLSVNIIVSQEP